MAISFSPQAHPSIARPRRRRHRRARADQYRQDPSRHRADAGAFLRHDRPAAAAAGARGLQQMRRSGRRRQRGADHRRGENQAAQCRASGSPPSKPCRATSTSRSSPSTRCSSAPISSAAMSSPTACSMPAPARKRWCWAPPPCGRWWKSCCPARISSAGRGCRCSLTPAKRSSPGCRAARPSSPSRRRKFTPSPN